ncbi:polysaccharide biosynthesis protein [Lysobacteraceae bacterium NML75-0749]|nr:polysaccharide biosynthesis protein [Xanthomonadaceae bacterium NML75-0749]PJK03124.1 polysaccharide biosynthesis protein [Xanthomonadaceae bacterium NML91-0268]
MKLSHKKRLWLSWPRVAVISHDLLMVVLVWLGLQWLRYEMQPALVMPAMDWIELLLVVALQGIAFRFSGLYHGLWRFASTPDLFNLLKASVLGVVAIVGALFLYKRLEGVPRSVLLMYPFALVMLLGMPRWLYRIWKDGILQVNRHETATRVLILGAGQAGENLLRNLRNSENYVPVGFLDDAPSLKGIRLHGVPVLGRIDDAADIARETAAGMLAIAMPSLEAAAMQRVMAVCESTGLPFRMVPRAEDLLDKSLHADGLKEVSIEDLLGRKPITANWQEIRNWLGGRNVLVTGAGGSIGSELCRQCARNGAASIILVEQNEFSLLQMAQELRRDFADVACVPILGDCGDPAVISHALQQTQVEAVFHAAAYKQVPVLEGQLREAIRNNVLATETVARISAQMNVGTFVLISTDKAVNPVNILGASKRLAEMVCQLHARQSQTHFVTVRFGNVLGSAGSVVPLFREQIRLGGPVTVTHPQVTRYFMTIPEASQLILQASSIGAHHAIYTLDMGEPVAIRVLAEQMIRLAGKQPGRDIAITYTGLRDGEKLHEVLFHDEESYCPTMYPKILQGKVRQVQPESLQASLKVLTDASARYDAALLLQELKKAVPEFEPGQHLTDGSASVIVPFPGRRNRKH